MKIPYWHLDAFSRGPHSGNPAAVVLLPAWRSTANLQAMAAEHNLNATAFLVRAGDAHEIRTFTPTAELPLCGHATLVAGYVVLNRLQPEAPQAMFHSHRGSLHVQRKVSRYAMDLPAADMDPAEPPSSLVRGLGARPSSFFSGYQCLAVYRTEDEITRLAPDFPLLAGHDAQVVIVTAPGTDCDFVSRAFAPRLGVPEDPVTGSAHTRLVPFWAKRLGRPDLFARQLSPRGGDLWCRHLGDRVELAGNVSLYAEGHIESAT